METEFRMSFDPKSSTAPVGLRNGIFEFAYAAYRFKLHLFRLEAAVKPITIPGRCRKSGNNFTSDPSLEIPG